jgi:hypothetical protein
VARRTVPPAGQDDQLVVLGLARGDRLRWHAGPSGRWRYGTVRGRERDGSVAVTDAGGAARSLPVERLEVRTRGARGGEVWEPLTAWAGRAEQLSLDLFA